MNRFIKQFILDHEDLIEDNKWDAVYTELFNMYGYSIISEFTATLEKSGIFPTQFFTRIPAGFHFNDLSLEHEVIPSNIKSIGASSYQWCTNLTTLQIQEGVEEIEEEAFQFCTKLDYVEIPSSVKTIYPGAFAASGLKKIKFNEGLQFIHNRAFINTKLEEVELPESLNGFSNPFPFNCVIKVKKGSGLEQVARSQHYRVEYI